jgi:Ion channel
MHVRFLALHVAEIASHLARRIRRFNRRHMKALWLDLAKFFAVLSGSLLLNLPLYLFKYGTTGIFTFCLIISSIYIAVAVLEVFRYYTVFPGFTTDQSFERRLKIAFILTLPFFVANVADEFFPRYVYGGAFRTETFAGVGGVLYGMLIGFLINPTDARLGRKARIVRKHWTRIGLVLGVVFGFLSFFANGLSVRAALHGLSVTFAFELGLGLGLLLGHNLNDWIEALEPTFELLRRMARTLFAYAAGFLVIVLLFASFFGAAWKFEGAKSFQGISASPTLTTFIYFSLLTATTVGYGDIAPRSNLTRALTGLETIVALAWTLVVFAAISVQFADSVRVGPSQSNSSTREEEQDSE